LIAVDLDGDIYALTASLKQGMLTNGVPGGDVSMHRRSDWPEMSDDVAAELQQFVQHSAGPSHNRKVGRG
jgi:hypothetical protein